MNLGPICFREMCIIKMKKWISLLLSLLLVLGVLPASAFAAGPESGDTLPETNIESVDAEPHNEDILAQTLDETPLPEEYQLSSLIFRSGNNVTKSEYLLEPAFSPEHREYTLIIQDFRNSMSTLSVWATLKEQESTAEIKIGYVTSINNQWKDNTVSSGSSKGTMLMYAFSHFSPNDMTITVGGETAYKITIVTSATLLGLSISNEENNISLSPAFGSGTTDVYEYSAVLRSSPSSITITPTLRRPNYGTKVKIDNTEVTSGDASEVTLDWKNEEDETGIAYRHARVVVTAVGETVPDVNARNNDYTLDFYTNRVESLKIDTPPTKTTYGVSETFDPTGMVVKAVYTDGTQAVVPDGAYTTSPSSGLLVSDTAVTISYKGKTVTQSIEVVKDGLTGEGTEGNPFQLSDADDLALISSYVAAGYSFEGEYLQLTDDITLPANWTPIGALAAGTTDAKQGVNIRPFSGTLDGNGKTITFASGSKPLFNYVREATVHDLTIDAPYMDGYALVDKYTVDYGEDGDYGTGTGGSYKAGCPDTIDIINVTIKSGSIIKNGGFLGGYASGGNTVNMKDCTVEAGVKIGCDASGNSAGNIQVGSLAGAFSGTMTNCVSYADVYGTNTVGGIVGCKGQSMGFFTITNCAFYGRVHATGNNVGGIVGRGYISSSAPNTMCVEINNCIFAGSIEGQNNVGGILGAEGHLQAWDNGVGNISNNLSMGTITATGIKGGIVGDISSLNQYNILSNNLYLDTQAADGIGAVTYVDTSHTAPTAITGVTYINTANSLPDIRGISKTNHNRTDDPLGENKEKLAKAFQAAALTDGSLVELLNNGQYSTKNWEQGPAAPFLNSRPIVTELKLSGTYKTEYYTGDALNTDEMTFTAVWSDKHEEEVPASEITFSGYNANTQAEQTVTAAYGAVSTTFTVIVRERPSSGTSGDISNKITVYFTLLGDRFHDQDENGNGIPTANGGPHTLKSNNLDTWISRRAYTVDRNITVWELMQPILADNNIEANTNKNSGTVYVAGLKRDGDEWLSEFTNGSNSGWMYTLDGKHPNLGVAQQFLTKDCEVIFHYTDDYTLEQDSEEWTTPSTTPGTTTPGTTTPGTTDPGTTEPGTDAPAAEPPATVDDSGEAKVELTQDAVNAILEEAKDAETDAIVIKPEITGEADKVTVILPTSAAESVIKASKTSVDVDAGIANIKIPSASLDEICGLQGANIGISAEIVKDESGTATGAVKIDLTVDEKPVEKTDSGILVTLPVTAEELSAGSVLVLVDADGNERVIQKSAPGEAGVTALLDGSCTVKVVDNTKTFEDTDSHWAAEAIAFTSSRELFQGTSEGVFAPNENMTRAMLVTVLHRLENTPDAAVQGAFGDVTEGTWYTDSVLWASEKGIVNGYSASEFAPNDNITREQLATMMYRYAGVLGMDVSATGSMSEFTDAGAISGWAAEAMEWAVGAGLIEGKGNGVLDPGGNATRAEVATILQRLVQLIVL